MDVRKYFKPPLLFGTIAIASPFIVILLLFLTSSILVALFSILTGIIMGFLGIGTGDKDSKKLSIIGIVLIALELLIGIPLIYLTF